MLIDLYKKASQKLTLLLLDVRIKISSDVFCYVPRTYTLHSARCRV